MQPHLKPLTRLTLALLSVLFSAWHLDALAQTSPVGLWKTIDDESKREKSLVRIGEADGALSGRIERLFHPEEPNPVCKQCSDERKDKPIVGLTILRHVRASADEPGVWTGGDILDPKNGKLYQVRLRPIDGGRALEVRGYIGFSLLGRTQTWIRVE